MLASLNNDSLLDALYSSKVYDTPSNESPIYAAPAPDNSQPPIYAAPAPDNSEPPVYASPAPMIDSDILVNQSNTDIMLIQNLLQI